MKRSLKKTWPLLGIGLLLIVVGFYLKGVPKKEMGEPISVETGLQAGIRFEDIHYTQDNPDRFHGSNSDKQRHDTQHCQEQADHQEEHRRNRSRSPLKQDSAQVILRRLLLARLSCEIHDFWVANKQAGQQPGIPSRQR